MAWEIITDGGRAYARDDSGREYSLQELVVAIQSTPTPELLGLLPRLASAHKKAVTAKIRAEEQERAAEEARRKMEEHIRPVEERLTAIWDNRPDAEISYIFSSGLLKVLYRIPEGDRNLLAPHADVLGRVVRLRADADGLHVDYRPRTSGGTHASGTPVIAPGMYRIRPENLDDEPPGPVIEAYLVGNGHRIGWRVNGAETTAEQILRVFSTIVPKPGTRPYSYPSRTLASILMPAHLTPA